MGIVKRIKQKLPIISTGGGADPATPAAPAEAAPSEPKSELSTHDRIDELVKSKPLVLFMKGSPQAPQCGFSANATAVLMTYGHPIEHVNVLADPDIRQGIKDYSQWPTIPQTYIGGEFVGGSDILIQMHEAGELKKLLDAAFAEA